MTIREIEDRSGLQRANIRYYEDQGLLCPRRAENGYRDYSDGDLETLLRIRLLRSLDFSIDEIRSLQKGERTMQEALSEKLLQLEDAKQRADYTHAVCAAMRQDSVSYTTLDAERYLFGDRVPQLPSRTQQLQSVTRQDVRRCTAAPWRRYFARSLDLSLCSLPLTALLTLAGHVNISAAGTWLTLFSSLISMLLMIFAEPLLLHFFGTTPGKWLMGLYVETENGGRPSVSDARRRTAAVLWRGMRFQIPVYSIVRLVRCWFDCSEREPMSWDLENGTEIRLLDTRPWRTAAIAGGYALFFFCTFCCFALGLMPPCRGELTVSEFARNYDFIQSYYGQETLYMNAEGQLDRAKDPNVVIFPDSEVFLPEFEYELDDSGFLRSVRFDLEVTDPGAWIGSVKDYALTSALAWIGCRDEACALALPQQKIARRANGEDITEGFDFTLYGVRACYTADVHGYIPVTGGSLLFPDETASSHMARFTMEMTLE